LGIVMILVFGFFCKRRNQRELYIDHYKVVGNISDDSVYNGHIKFYDSASEILAEEGEYRNGVLNGMRINYDSNGKVFSILNYENGKNIGYNRYYDSLGNLTDQEYFYYDVKVGPSITYFHGKAKVYDFYAFDNNLIYSLNYDSLQKNIIVNLGKNFFHITKLGGVTYIDGNRRSEGLEFSIYTLNPPKYKFDYDLVLIDSLYHVEKVIEKLESEIPFLSFKIPNLRDGNYLYAIRLQVVDSLNSKSDYLMFKKLQ